MFRIVVAVNDKPQKSTPSNPMRGKSLAVVGSFLGVGSSVVADFLVVASAVSTGGVGWAKTIRIGTPGVGAAGVGGAVPLILTWCSITVSGTSVTL
jgi:hypothetical protein